MEKIIIRQAKLSELDTLLGFERGIIEAERPYDVTLKEGEIHYYDITAMIQADHIAVLVAELDGQLIGSGYARIENVKPYLKHAQHAYLGFMYTHPDHRGKGVNRLIIEELANWARSRGVTELRLDVYHLNTAAVKAYEKAGFSGLLLNMRRPI
ncbi:GNAT family N-acetyltransferase [Chitinophaga vietnamensis]|uniref:GNAT family N-acetyltransferase n=1 Tax=Chitinophaga vietnamensis TaxID=2593957 RepID=UPI0011784F03|nr:GNAT family N-acetyltransferase [Chitinophaga vietnamensis]